MPNTVISYPTPIYSNLQINSQFYRPSRFIISAIDQGKTTIVTTTTDMNYVIGQLVRLHIPPEDGIRDINERQGYVISLPDTDQVEIDIDSSMMSAFVNASTTNLPQICAIGDINSGYQSSTGRFRQQFDLTIPGSFQNISPQ